MVRIVKRYESRKLYDTEESRYVSLDDVAQWVRSGQDVKVVDNSSSEDVTAQVLTQIIHEEGKRGTAFLPTDLLHELVRAGERAFSTGVEQVQGRLDRFFQASIDRLGPVRQAREEMAVLRERLSELETTLSKLESDEPVAEPPARAKTNSTGRRKAAAKKAPAAAEEATVLAEAASD